MVARAVALLAAAACSGKARPDEATPAAPRSDAALAGETPGETIDAATGDARTASGHPAGGAIDVPEGRDGGDAPDARGARGARGARDAPGARDAKTGDLQVRVVWPDAPAAARRSPGRTPCNTPRAPSVAPTTTWGVPEALVVVDGAAAPRATVRITLADCALAPPIAAGASLVIASAVDRPARVVLRRRGALDPLAAGDPVPVLLPIAGHTVTAALDAGAIYSLETDAADPELAFVATLPGSHITDAAGQTVVHDLAPGAHAVIAWLPPRAGQPARLVRGTAQVKPGALTELTLTLAP